MLFMRATANVIDDGSHTSKTLVQASPIKAGDLLVIDFLSSGSAPATPTGYTLVTGANLTVGSEWHYTFTKTAVGTEGGANLTCSLSGAAGAIEVIQSVYASTDGTTPQVGAVSTLTNSGAATSRNFPSTNPPTKSGSLIHLSGHFDSTASFGVGPISIFSGSSGSLAGYFGCSGTVFPSPMPTMTGASAGNWAMLTMEIQTSNGSSAGSVPIGTGGVAQHNSSTPSVSPARSVLEAVGDTMIADICQQGTSTVLPPPDITSRASSVQQTTSGDSQTLTIPASVVAGDLMLMHIARGASSHLDSPHDIQLRASINQNNSTVTIPASVKVGDLMIVYVANGSAVGAPAGWTLIGTNSTNFPSGAWFRVATAGDTGGAKTYTFTPAGNSLQFSAWFSFTGATVSVGVSSISSSGNANNANAPNITTGTAKSIVLLIVNQGGASNVSRPGSTYNVNETQTNFKSAYLFKSTAGAIGTFNWTSAGSNTWEIASIEITSGNVADPWTLVGDSGDANPIAVYSRVATSLDTGGSITVPFNIDVTTYLRLGFSAWYTLSGAAVSIDQSASTTASGNNNDVSAAVTTTANHEIVLVCFNQGTTSGTPSLPTPVTQEYAVQVFVLGWFSLPTAGGSGTVTVTYGSNSGNQSFTISLKSATPVAAWNLIREDTDPTNTIKKSLFWRKTVSGEPGSYQFWYSTASASSDSVNISSFGNLDGTTPVETGLCDGATYIGIIDGNSVNIGYAMPRVLPMPNDECLYFSAGANISARSMSITSPASPLANSPAGNAAACYGYGGIDLADAGWRGDQLNGYVLGANIAVGIQPRAGVTQVAVLKAASTPARPTANVRVSQLSGVIMSSALFTAGGVWRRYKTKRIAVAPAAFVAPVRSRNRALHAASSSAVSVGYRPRRAKRLKPSIPAPVKNPKRRAIRIGASSSSSGFRPRHHALFLNRKPKLALSFPRRVWQLVQRRFERPGVIHVHAIMKVYLFRPGSFTRSAVFSLPLSVIAHAYRKVTAAMSLVLSVIAHVTVTTVIPGLRKVSAKMAVTLLMQADIQTYPIFPVLPGMAWNIVKTAEWNTKPFRTAIGRMYRATNWSQPRWHFEIPFNFLRELAAVPEYEALLGLFATSLGQAGIFLYDDPTDDLVPASAPVTLRNGDGVIKQFQLARAFYTSAGSFLSFEYVYALKPNPVIYLNGVAQLASSYTIQNGMITFNTPPGNGVAVSWSGGFYFVCRFSDDSAPFESIFYKYREMKGIKFQTKKLP